jgi:hypothetical protein
MKNFFLGILTVVIIGAVGFFAYQYGRKSIPNSTPTPITSTPASPLVSPELTAAVETPTPSTSANDAELIKAALYKKNNWPNNNAVKVVVNTNDGIYASGTAGGQGGGGYFYAAKVNGEWKIVADGNGIISCSDLTPYPNYPKSLIPSCFDQATQNIVNR